MNKSNELEEKLMQAINGLTKWEVNRFLGDSPMKVREDNGYFGSYSHISCQGKEAVVYVDDRDAIVHVRCGFFDKIFYGQERGGDAWDGDMRWNYDKPVVVYKKYKGYNICAPHCNKLLLSQWMKKIEPECQWNNVIGHYFIGVDKQGNDVKISTNGNVLHNVSPESIQKTLATVKSYSYDDIINLWINKDMPCAHIRGLEYKGARAGIISKENALDMFKTHHSFNCMFNSAEWDVINGQVTLLMRDYANSDYD